MKVLRIIKRSLLLLLLLHVSMFSSAQTEKKKISMKDTVDGKLDLSQYIIEANGFVPVPIVVTDKALGGFGGGLAPLFIKKNAPYLDSINGKLVVTPVAPDVTGGAFLYTLNNSWLAAAFRSGVIVKHRIKYSVGFGYMNMNLSFYRKDNKGDEAEFKFNFKGFGGSVQATKRLGFSNWYAGMKYQLMSMNVNYVGASIPIPPELGKPQEYNSTMAALGAIVELDSRDNIFTPNKGIKAHFDANRSDNIFGSDYEYWRLNYYGYMYTKLGKNITGGWRLDGQQAIGNTPFYLLPYIDMRGIPAARYQGKADVLTEVEARFDITSRWSLMAFSGVGKAFNNWNDFGSADWVYSYGTGFRYFLARAFNLRTGLDIAKGPPGCWGYYIVVGSSWMK
jgi:hypothetical protein